MSNEKVKPAEVVLRLEAGNAQRLLDAFPEALVPIAADEQRELRRQLRAALDSLPVEERVEYRVVGKAPELPPIEDGGKAWQRGPTKTLKQANLEAAAEEEYGSTDIRIQSRTVLASPWTDLPSEEGES